MVYRGYFLLLFLLPVAAAQTPPGSCSGCGPLSLPLLASLVAAEAAMSLVMVGVVFACARSPRRGSPQGDGTVYINMPSRG
ncbi:hematopoietic cell signal transducer isoform X1 [Dipodomys spectabilis]|uniref:hematopoietic cell signal transducer isoform X1 n=1 Tax=Dipodomys spectabilis TaxID=105255 RepID=UPI001C54A081|nr:hematopoietic cell signal transducer isoform X1 [Dipodomys spectabilis]